MDDCAAAGPLPPAQALYDDAPCGLLVTAPDGLVLRANRTFCTWVGHEAAALVSRVRMQDLLTMGGRIFHQTHWRPLLEMQGSVREVKLEVLHADGRPLPMVFNAVRRGAGAAWHEIAVFLAHDRHQYEKELLLARRRAEEMLERHQQSQRALAAAQHERDQQQEVAQDRALFAEQMMAIVSHDLRNPLSVIRMSAHLIGMGELSPNQLRALERLTTSTSRATRLIADLLDFSQARLGSGLQVSLKPVDDLHGLVAEALEDLRLAFPGRSLVHEARGQGGGLASSDRLVQLIGNLVANAVAYGAADRPVVVTSAVDAATFSLEVANEGPDIPADLLPRLFDPMTRGAGAQDGRHSVGLGLFIVREIVRAHGGTVAVQSAGGVTRFGASFPRTPPIPSP